MAQNLEEKKELDPGQSHVCPQHTDPFENQIRSSYRHLRAPQLLILIGSDQLCPNDIDRGYQREKGMDPFDNVNPSAARMNYVEPQQEETAQADFEQRLREPQPIPPTSASPGAGSTRTATDGNKRAQAIQENERCAAASFVRTRAQLAATLTCANIAELRREIELAAQR
ncbi:hypothetical protein [Bradyrhizobium ottawaense]|uniref:hypothetical protein n=1 Tax=Bradyrhizobium ottawaense TaxID=931866 RepID=UPI003F9F81EA